MKSSCGIADQNICISGFGCCHGIIDNRCRICSVLAADDLNACTVSPLCQLLSGCRTEGEISFTSETQKEYIDQTDYKQKTDKIDIFINKLGLAQTWGENEDKIYFAIECKRISNLSDTSRYIGDLLKFTNRSYIEIRLPFEGQLGFIESHSLSDRQIVEEINAKLRHASHITTERPLRPCPIHPDIPGTYKSIHRRNTNIKETFSIYHIFLDYSDIVTS